MPVSAPGWRVPFCAAPRFALRPVAGLLALLGVLGGCETAPLQETKQFQQAFVAVDGVSEPVLDDAAIAERAQGQEIANASAKRITANKPPLASHADCTPGWKAIDRTTGFVTGFCLPDAGFYAKIGDPPQTRAFRKALALIGQFAGALTALADGTSAAAATAQVQQLAQNAGALAGTVSAATGVGAAIGPAVTGLAKALSPLIGQLAGAASAEQERQVILDARAKVGDLIVALRNAAPALFATLTQSIQSQLELEDHPQASEVARIEGYRVMLANYVVLLDQLNDAWNQLVAAAKQPSNPVALASLAQSSAQIAADAAAVRQSLAALRQGGTP